jgi:4-hydroxy-3-polyprenylbenzoate decarboxylase
MKTVPKVLTVAQTGASGAVLTRELIRRLDTDTRVERVDFIISEGGLRVCAEEIGIPGRSKLLNHILGHVPKKTFEQANMDIGGSVASGSYPSDVMIVLPCSMGTLARIANGMAQALIERAADVTLKENRPLILCVRETPYNRIHLRNMQLASDAGAVIYPVTPVFYDLPKNTEDMAKQYVDRVLGHIGLPQKDAYVWSGRARK